MTTLIIIGVIVIVAVAIIGIILSQKKDTKLPEYENPPPEPDKFEALANKVMGENANNIGQNKPPIPPNVNVAFRNSKGQFVKGKDALAFLDRGSNGRFKKKA